MVNYITRTLKVLATATLFACSNPTAPEAPLELRNSDCEVKRLHNSLYETILGYDGQHGLHIISPMTVELRTTRMKSVAGFVGHDRVRGMYFREDGSSMPTYFSEGYIPNGDPMACDLAERLLAVAESQR